LKIEENDPFILLFIVKEKSTFRVYFNSDCTEVRAFEKAD